MVKVQFTRTSVEKYKLLLNGIRKEVNRFLDALVKDSITPNNLNQILEHEGTILYSKKCGEIYVLLAKFKNDWVIFDFLTTQEYKKIGAFT